MPLHSKFHLRRNPLKKLPDINTQIINNNGCELPNTIKTPQMFKKSNPLFVVNGLFGSFLVIQTFSRKTSVPTKNIPIS